MSRTPSQQITSPAPVQECVLYTNLVSVFNRPTFEHVVWAVASTISCLVTRLRATVGTVCTKGKCSGEESALFVDFQAWFLWLQTGMHLSQHAQRASTLHVHEFPVAFAWDETPNYPTIY